MEVVRTTVTTTKQPGSWRPLAQLAIYSAFTAVLRGKFNSLEKSDIRQSLTGLRRVKQ